MIGRPLGFQRSSDRLGLFVDDPQQGGCGAADAAGALLPFAVAGEAHAHERCHLGLLQPRALADLPRVKRRMHKSRPLAFRVGQINQREPLSSLGQ